MSDIDIAWQAAQDAAQALAPEADLVADLDMAGFGGSLLAVLNRAMERPAHLAEASLRLTDQPGPGHPVRGGQGDRVPGRPAHRAGPRQAVRRPAWEDNPAFAALRQYYLATRQFTGEVLDAGRGDPVSDGKAQLAAGFMLDAFSPTNFLVTNPAALKRAFETGGASLVAGARNFLDDLVHNNGRPRQVDTSPFHLGENMAATPGKVVYSSDADGTHPVRPADPAGPFHPDAGQPALDQQVLHHGPGARPQLPRVGRAARAHRLRHLLPQPRAEMRGITLDDYLIGGPKTALDVISDITGSPKINITGLCLGGALTAMLAAYLVRTGDDRINSIALLNTMLDYSEPGVLGAFTDQPTIARLERQMEAEGVLEGSQMAGTFDMLRANDLIFNYVVSNWLMGKQPPAFDILAWNGDSTRMPAAMHSFYLRSLYVRNELAKGELELAGQRLSLDDVKSDTYVVGAVNDHIVPWTTSYKATRLLGGHVRYVLSSGGHIAGIVNPPGPKAWYMRRRGLPAQRGGVARRRGAQDGSWWEDWADWAGSRAGDLVKPPKMGSRRYPALGDAPGQYVRG